MNEEFYEMLFASGLGYDLMDETGMDESEVEDYVLECLGCL